MELNKALPIAEKVVEALAPYCEVINIAGSIRRRKPDVGDIEVVCLPKRTTYLDLLTGERRKLDRVKKFAEAAKSLGRVTKGSLYDGKQVEIQLKDGIKLDLFIPVEPNYYRLFATRTGSEDYAKYILGGAWRQLGWCGAEGELRRISECEKVGEHRYKCVSPNPQLPPVWTSEQEFFDWLKLDWVEPVDRNI